MVSNKPQPAALVLHQVRLGFFQPQTQPLSLQLAQGARIALTGPNGSGKSLLLKAVVGQARVFSGQLTFGQGIRPTLLAQEHPRPTPWPLSGADWFAAMQTQPPEHPDVEKLLTRRLDRISGGQWQLLRLAACVAEHATPAEQRLLLLDEPANHLDAATRDTAIDLLHQLPAMATVLMTSHDAAFLSRLPVEEQPIHALAEIHE